MVEGSLLFVDSSNDVCLIEDLPAKQTQSLYKYICLAERLGYIT